MDRKCIAPTYVAYGRWISSASVASHILLLARTKAFDPKAPTAGLSLFYTPLDRKHVTIRPIPKMGGRAIDSNELFFEDLPIPESDLLGAEGQGFKMVLQGMNAERCLLAGEAIGTGLAALKRATLYAQERVVFSRPIGQNQGIAHPLAEAWMNLEAAKLVAYRAAEMFDRGGESSTAIGAYCNSAKYLAAEAAFKACERAVLTLGGMGYAQVSSIKGLI
jgi:acyl-CoA dehydrogenase